LLSRISLTRSAAAEVMVMTAKRPISVAPKQPGSRPDVRFLS
jgi:hypothetical protein